jgi:TolB-like protein
MEPAKIRGRGTESAAISTNEIHRHLAKILASATFAESERLRTLLRWLVVETLEGRDETLKEAVVGVAVFHRQPGWDQHGDAIVRVQVRNLRLCLARYYEQEGASDQVRIHIPKGGYHPLFERWTKPGLAQRLPRRVLWLAAGLLAAMLCLVSWVWFNGGLYPSRPVVVGTFANLTGDPRQNLVAAGLSQEVTGYLSQDTAMALRAVPPTVAVKDPQRQACPGTTGFWLSGSLAAAPGSRADTWLVTALLVDCRTGRQLWAKQFERSGPRLESVSRLIATEVERSLR